MTEDAVSSPGQRARAWWDQLSRPRQLGWGTVAALLLAWLLLPGVYQLALGRDYELGLATRRTRMSSASVGSTLIDGPEGRPLLVRQDPRTGNYRYYERGPNGKDDALGGDDEEVLPATIERVAMLLGLRFAVLVNAIALALWLAVPFVHAPRASLRRELARALVLTPLPALTVAMSLVAMTGGPSSRLELALTPGIERAYKTVTLGLVPKEVAMSVSWFGAFWVAVLVWRLRHEPPVPEDE